MVLDTMKTIDVTAAIIWGDAKVLVAQRPKEDKLSLMWEFPGGKVESDEAPEDSLRRELFEEFEIDGTIGDFYCISEYEYPHVSVRLLAYFVTSVKGDFVVKSHEKIEWAHISQLKDYNFAPADIPIVKKLIGDYNG